MHLDEMTRVVEGVHLRHELATSGTTTSSIAKQSDEIDDTADFDDSGSEVDGKDELKEDDPQIRPLTERQRRHHDLLTEYISQHAWKKENKEKGLGMSLKDLADEEMTINDLMTRKTDKKIIGTPREYQIELFERAKERNTIAVLDTGSGKTLIAALLIRWMFDEELVHRKAGGKHRIMFFVVGSVALTFQQYGMLSCNLDQRLVQLYGDMNVDHFSIDHWQSILRNCMGVVCTAEVLYQCLTRSFIKIEDINLLIFDEAHHAKKDHSFSQIMKQHYHRAERSQRPRVFGMTASPVDAKTDVVLAAEELETTLDSQIATTRDTKVLQNAVSRPNEMVVYYSKPSRVQGHTELTLKLKSTFENAPLFQKLYQQAHLFRLELGDWCCDRYWELCFREEAGEKVENEYKKLVGRGGNVASLEEQNKAMEQIKKAREIIWTHTFAEPKATDNELWTHKAEKLRQYLASKFTKENTARCIVFVRHRTIAFLLSDLLKCMGPSCLRPAPMVGTRKTEVGEIPYSLGTQIRTLAKFEKGEYNCILATTIAEEGLDVADCNTIVRYDLYDTMIQYVQSRGRARYHDSVYIHMLEAGNFEHEERLRMARESETIMRRFCESLPDDRILEGNEDGMDRTLAKEEGWGRYKEKTTGAILDYHSSLILLHHYVDMLSQTKDVIPGTILQPTYIVTRTGANFICEVLIPEPCPIRSIMGKMHSRKSTAKRSAAFNACLRLRKERLLNEHLMPNIKKYINNMRNAQLAVSENKKSSYEMISKPRFWESTWGHEAKQLYVTILDLSKPGVCGRPHSPVALLTREKLPHIPSFQIYPSPGSQTDAICTHLTAMLGPDCFAKDGADTTTAAAEFRSIVTKLTKFTLRCFHDLFNKRYEHDETALSYWLAPVVLGAILKSEMDVMTAIDWEAVEYVCENDEAIKWDHKTDLEAWKGCFLVDPWSGARRYFFDEFAPEYSPEDKPPPNVRTFRSGMRYMGTIKEYTCSKYGGARQGWLDDLDPHQTVIKAYAMRHKRNLLEPWNESDMIDDAKNDVSKTLAYICVEQLYRSPLPPSVVALLWNFPSFIFRIESHLIAQEACERLGLTITPALSLEALTKDSDNTHEHNEQQVNQQKGMGRNYERLEFIGDCFLKMATSISLYTLNANDDEFESHVKRMLMICNKNLFTHAIRKDLKLHEYIRVQGLKRQTWYPEGLKLLNREKLKVKNKADTSRLSDKTIADVCEALIGAALLTYEETSNMDEAVKAVTAVVKNPNHNFSSWAEYYSLYQKPEFQTRPADAFQEDLAKRCFEKHKYMFKYPRLLYCAFKHPSHPYSFDKMPNYQRLEFLGDSLYDQVCVNFLYKRHPDRNPQWLTEHKMAMVSNQFLGFICVKLQFNVHIRHNQGDMVVKIKQYIDSLHTVGKGAIPSTPNGWMDASDPPKCLPDMVEAYLGAIFVDSEYDFHEIERFFDAHIAEHFQDMSIYDDFARGHPVTRLQNLLHDEYHCSDFALAGQPIPKASGEGGPQMYYYAIFIHGAIARTHKCQSTRYGKPAVCEGFVKEYLEKENEKGVIERMDLELYRAKFGCDCVEREKKGLGPAIPASERIPSAI